MVGVSRYMIGTDWLYEKAVCTQYVKQPLTIDFLLFQHGLKHIIEFTSSYTGHIQTDVPHHFNNFSSFLPTSGTNVKT